MKDTRFLAVLAAVSLLLAGCGDSGSQSSNTTKKPAATTAPADSADSGTPEADASSDDTEKRNAGEYQWYQKPFLAADDVNVFPAAAGDYAYGMFMDTEYRVISRGGKLGMVDSEGKIVLEPAFDAVECVNSDNGQPDYIFYNSTEDSRLQVCFCTKAGSAELISGQNCALCGGSLSANATGISALYDEEANSCGGGNAYAIHETAAGGKITLDDTFLEAVYDMPDAATVRSVTLPDGYSGGKGDAELGGTYGVIRGGQLVAGLIYENATDFSEGTAAFCRDGKWGYLNESGRQLIPFSYDADFICSYGAKRCKTKAPEWGWDLDDAADAAKPETLRESSLKPNDICLPYLPSEGYIAVNSGDEAGFYDLEGDAVVPVGTFMAARPVCGGLAWVQDASTKLWGIISFDPALKAPKKQFADENKAQQAEDDAEANEDWRAAYAEAAYDSDAQLFSLCYIDGDDIPELILHTGEGSAADHDAELYTYYNGEAVSLGNIACGMYSCAKYYAKQGVLLTGWANDDKLTEYRFVKLEDGRLDDLQTFSIDRSTGTKYTVDGDKADQNAFLKKWKENNAGNEAFALGMFKNTVTNIEEQLAPLDLEE